MDTMTNHRASALKYGIERMIPGFSGSFVGSVPTVLCCLILISVVIFPPALPASPYKGQEQETKEQLSKLSDEEKEIINNREMLEMLPLLQNLERIELIDLLNEMETDLSDSEESVGPEEKKEEGKKP